LHRASEFLGLVYIHDLIGQHVHGLSDIGVFNCGHLVEDDFIPLSEGKTVV
jgi:hypothetical protein